MGKGITEKYRVQWFVHKDLDQFTYIYLKIAINAEGDEKAGNANIRIKPYLRTEYPQDTLWERSFVYEMLRSFYHKIFYADKVKQYVSDCRDWILFIQNEMKSFFNVLQKS